MTWTIELTGDDLFPELREPRAVEWNATGHPLVSTQAIQWDTKWRAAAMEEGEGRRTLARWIGDLAHVTAPAECWVTGFRIRDPHGVVVHEGLVGAPTQVTAGSPAIVARGGVCLSITRD